MRGKRHKLKQFKKCEWNAALNHETILYSTMEYIVLSHFYLSQATKILSCNLFLDD
jgi:hypothetical protein